MFPPAFVLHPLPASWCHSHHQCDSVFPSGNWMTESSGDPRWDFISWGFFFRCLVNFGARLTCFVLLFHFGAVFKEKEVWDNE